MTLAAACASQSGAPGTPVPGTPASPPSPELEQQLIKATAPDTAQRITFDWVLQESEARFTGKGLARVQGPYHARLDLFGPRGDTYLTSALVEMELRLPPGVQLADVPIPPPPLFWSAMGTFRPPEGATLQATTRSGDNATLVYSAPHAKWTFEFVGTALRRAEWDDDKTGRQTVELTPGGALGLPKQSVYRDWPAFRQLTITLDQASNADSFPPDTWTPGQR